MISVLVAEAYPLLCEALRHVAAATDDLAVNAEAAHAEEVLAQAQATALDVVLLDLGLPGESWRDILRRLQSEHPTLPILTWGIHADPAYARHALRVGAAGYLTKAAPPRQVLDALRAAARGEVVAPPPVVHQLARRLPPEAQLPHDGLSEREFEVMRRIARGETTREIADALALSPKTVSTYRTRISRKLALRNDVQIARYALRHGLVE